MTASPPPADMREAQRSRPRFRSLVVAVAGLLVFAGAVIYGADAVDADSGGDIAGSLHRLLSTLSRLRWQFTALVVVLAAAHYLVAAVAARAATSMPLRLSETVLVQLAAAAANRLTPGGFGGAAVNTRFFTRRGMDVRGAVGAVALLTVLGGVADIVVFGLLLGAGRLVGLGGGTGAVTRLWTQTEAQLHRLASGGALVIALIVAAVLIIILIALRRRAQPSDRASFTAPIRAMWRRPRSAAVLMTASGATTLILAFAFVESTRMLPGPVPTESVGALTVAFMAAAALGNLVPVPAGIGSTEAALTAVLVDANVPAAHAVVVVLAFRLVTFWLPAAIGVLAGRRLHRAGAI